MRKVILFLLLVGIGFWFWYSHSFPHKNYQKISQVAANQAVTATPAILSSKSKQVAVFVPYWTVGTTPISTSANRFIYFGITVNENGIDTSEPGYKNIGQFTQDLPGGGTEISCGSDD